MNKEKNFKILDLGCGAKKYPGSVGVDRLSLQGVDVTHDLEKFPYPFDSNSFDKVVAFNSIEHIEDTVSVFKEVFRILKPGGIFHFEIPHYSATDMFKDPTHKSFFAYSTVGYFTPGDDLYEFSYASDVAFTVLSRKITFWGTRKVFDKPQEFIFNKIPNLYERKLCWIFPAYQLIVDLKSLKKND